MRGIARPLRTKPRSHVELGRPNYVSLGWGATCERVVRHGMEGRDIVGHWWWRKAVSGANLEF
jgi:hypothetical protein